MKLSKCYASYKYDNITICQEPDVEKEDFLTGEKKMCKGRIYWSLQSKDEINQLIQTGKDLKWKVVKHPNGKETYEFSIKEDTEDVAVANCNGEVDTLPWLQDK